LKLYLKNNVMKLLRSITIIVFVCLAAVSHAQNFKKDILKILKDQDLKEASWALTQQPVTVTAEFSSRSAGGKHDFFSEADYFWPDSTNLEGPYVNRDGLSNPNNFVAHRLAMIRLSKIVGALASAYKITRDEKYVRHAITHLNAWFIDPETLMNPNLQYAQAIKGRSTGRSYGIIDTIHLMEVAQGIIVMSKATCFEEGDKVKIKKWFSDYVGWLTTHPNGVEEMNAKNNHSTCWVMQVASFARLTGQKEILDFCRERYKTILLPSQMGIDGSFPLEIKRTKPYGYSIFNLDAMTMICQILSTAEDNLWKFETPDKKSIGKGITFLYPYLNNKNNWPYAKDVMYWENWPVAQPSLVFGALAFKEKNWLTTWSKLDHNPQEREVIRNLPIRHPLIWLD
jgi:hypothetical protein